MQNMLYLNCMACSTNVLLHSVSGTLLWLILNLCSCCIYQLYILECNVVLRWFYHFLEKCVVGWRSFMPGWINVRLCMRLYMRNKLLYVIKTIVIKTARARSGSSARRCAWWATTAPSPGSRTAFSTARAPSTSATSPLTTRHAICSLGRGLTIRTRYVINYIGHLRIDTCTRVRPEIRDGVWNRKSLLFSYILWWIIFVWENWNTRYI